MNSFQKLAYEIQRGQYLREKRAISQEELDELQRMHAAGELEYSPAQTAAVLGGGLAGAGLGTLLTRGKPVGALVGGLGGTFGIGAPIAHALGDE